LAIQVETFNDDLVQPSRINAPDIVPEFRKALDVMVAMARTGQPPDSQFFNPDGDWLKARMRIFQDLPENERQEVLREIEELKNEAEAANSQGKAAMRAGPDVVFRVDNGGMACYSQLGVARRPDLTQYFIEDFNGNRDSLSFSETNQRLFAEILPYVTRYMQNAFAEGARIIQTDRQVCDAPGRSFHARQLLFGDHYPQLSYLWRQLTFDLPPSEFQQSPDILEVSVPRWLEDLGLPDELVGRVKDAGLTQLVFRSPTRGLSFHLGFDYLGEHKMGPLSIAMFLVKEKNGLAVQAALSMARAKTIQGQIKNTAVVTAGPSLHGKSTLTIMMEFGDSDLARLLGLVHDPKEGVYPMNDDIILLHPLDVPVDTIRGGNRLRISYGIDGTENNLYAVPFGLNRQDDPITYDVVRGTEGDPNPQESLENVVVDPATGVPDYSQNPVRNMRMILSRSRLIERKGASHLLSTMTDGRMQSSVHVPMLDTDRIFWQAVMRQNTVVPPLRRLSLEQYVRVLMYGEAVQMGAAIGAIGRPYVEYFSDPFIIGLEDENANLLYHILQQLSWDGMPLNYYVFNTGGVGADSNEEASGANYKKIPRELTLMLQEALLRDAVRFEYDSTMRAEVAVAILNLQGEEILDLRQKWLPINIYGKSDYAARVVDLRRRRYYGESSEDKAGILRYTKTTDALIDFGDVPVPENERELAWLLSFHWNVNNAYDTLRELAAHRSEGKCPSEYLTRALQWKYNDGAKAGLVLSEDAAKALRAVGLRP